MRLLKNIALAFGMYTRLPMPKVEWSTDNMRHVLCVFPFIGAVIGLIGRGWAALAALAGFSTVLTAAGMTVLPVLIAGGIHMDGFCDTADALASHAAREKKLAILSDPHTGAFAVISVVLYFTLYFAICYELVLTGAPVYLWSVTFIISRILAGIGLLLFPAARETGLAHTFSAMASKRPCVVFLSAASVSLAVFLMWLAFTEALVMIIIAAVFFLYWKKMCLKHFGGITGDLTGWFLQLCELLLAGGLAAAMRL
ncbi:MAG: adenosylcobinamide-GDP ribazoletransferase [Oscillospiraceae bacterium]|nr:adenosylcobinamide-GDP ribazoletransferase [Oscillospiraceae bacterium]